MISTPVSSSVRKGAAIAGVAGLLVLAGCSSTPEQATADTPPVDESPAFVSSGEYNDGTYTADGAYQTPETVEQISVTLTLEGGIVTAVDVTGNPQARESKQYQGAFVAGISDEIVGVAIDDLDVHRVAGSSLTSGGFNSA